MKMYISPPPNFRGLVWEPGTEQDVVLLFGQLLDRRPSALAIEYSWTAFPDCIATDVETGQRIGIEFEYRASKFLVHRSEWLQLKKDDPLAHWWVVCWCNDLNERQGQELAGLTVVSLRDQARDAKIVLNWYDGDPDDPVAPADVERKFDWRSAGQPEHLRVVLNRLKEFGSSEGFVLDWARKPDLPWFTVRHRNTQVECFKVYGNGMIGFPFSRMAGLSSVRKTELLGKLDVALGTNWFRHREGKKKGCDVAWLVRDGRTIDPFLAVWQYLG